jgi:hypothetical protein
MGDVLPRDGSFSENPFACVLFGLWRAEATGQLTIETGEAEKFLHLQSGDVVVERKGLSLKDFLGALAKKRVLTSEQVRQCARTARSDGISLLKAVSELGYLSPLPLWNLLESFYARRLFPLFDREDGNWTFDPGAGLPVRERIGLIPGQELILQGIRQMQNPAVFERFLPEDRAPIRVCAPAHMHKIAWEPHERYALQVVGSVPNLKSFFEATELSLKEARKILFGFFALGILSPAESRSPSPGRPGSAPESNRRALESLNEKCAFLYRYVTKEIGPLGRTIVARAIEEIKPGLGTLFQKTTLLPDGHIEADPALRPDSGHFPDEMLAAMIRGYEEILLAEIQAVRKTLGVRHESALVQALEKVG